MTSKEVFITAVENGDIDAVKGLLTTEKTLVAQIDAAVVQFRCPCDCVCSGVWQP